MRSGGGFVVRDNTPRPYDHHKEHQMPHTAATRLRLVGSIAVLALVAAACGSASNSTPTDPSMPTDQAAPGIEAPTTTFTTFDGAPVSLAEFRGEPVVLNFWASWCPSCVAEMSAAFRPVREDLGDTITFLGVNIQDERALALELLEETGVGWVNAEDRTGGLYAALGGLGLPFTVVISADGSVLEAHNGPLNEGQLRTLITTTLG